MESNKLTQSRERRRRSNRRGAAAVEAAVCLPILLIFAFGTIESCNCIFTRQGLVVAAFEGARVAIVPGAKRENVEAQINRILEQRGIRGATISLDPPVPTGLPSGSLVTVTVEAPASSNSTFRLSAFGSMRLRGSTTMMTEY